MREKCSRVMFRRVAIARMTQHSCYGALYCLTAGEHENPKDSRVFWLTRTRGVNWREIVPQIVKSADAKVTVWRR